MFMKRLYGAVRCRTSSTHVNEVYAEQKTQEIFSTTGERVRNVSFQSSWRGNKYDCLVYIGVTLRTSEILFNDRRKGKKCQLSVRLARKQEGLSVYRSYVTYVSDSIQC